MDRDPESVLRTAFEAVAAGDARLLLELLEPGALEARRAMQLQLADAIWRRQQSGVITPEEFRASMWSFFHAGDPEELRSLDTGEHLQRTLDGLPPRRRRLRCDPLGHVLEPPDLAHVTFRLRWSAEADPALRIATLRRMHDGWRLLPDPLSEWVVPGLENLLFPLDDPDGTNPNGQSADRRAFD